MAVRASQARPAQMGFRWRSSKFGHPFPRWVRATAPGLCRGVQVGACGEVVSQGDSHPGFGCVPDEFRSSRAFRCDRHHSQEGACERIDAVEERDGGVLNEFRLVASDRAGFRRKEGSLQVHARDTGEKSVGGGRLLDDSDIAPVEFLRTGDNGWQEQNGSAVEDCLGCAQEIIPGEFRG